MIKLITHNPYRLLGLFSNSPTKDKVANMSKLKAFIKVGRSISYELDLNGLLPPIERTEKTVAEADARLTLPADQLKYAQFWFMKVSPFDEVAFNHLFKGDISKANEIWSKKDTATSLQNRIVCALINDDFATACSCAEKLYTQFYWDFVAAATSGGGTTSKELAFDFLDNLAKEIGVNQLMPHIQNNEWKNHLNTSAVTPIIENILSEVEIAKSNRQKGPEASFKAGMSLMTGTKHLLAQLKQLVPANDMQYQLTVDKLANEILQCGIDYYNKSNDNDSATKAMKLQRYAQSIAVGTMVKQRCDENVAILEKIIKELPPAEVMSEDKAITEELRKYCELPDLICHAITLLQNTKPHLQTIKARLGATNDYYLRISTTIVGNALHNIIEEVNDSQSDEMVEIGGKKVPMSMLAGGVVRDQKLEKIKETLIRAWEATKLMDTFDMEPSFKAERYDKNRATLSNMYDDFVLNKPNPASFSSSSSSDDSDLGWLKWVICVIILIAIKACS